MTPPPQASLDGLRVFLSAARIGTFTGAAADLGLSQPSVSAQIASLERRLGYALFERRPGGVETTPKGRELAERIAPGLDALLAVSPELEPESDDLPTVFLAGPAEFLSHRILPRLTEQLDPGIRIRTRFGLAEPLLDELVSGAVDVVISSVQPRHKGIAMAPMFDEEFALVAHPKWAVQDSGRDHASTDRCDAERNDAEARVRGIPLLAYADDLPIIRRYWQTVFDRRPTGFDVRIVVPDLRVIADLVASGAGMSVLPTYLIGDRLASGALVRLAEPKVAPLNTMYLATRRNSARKDPAVEAVRAALLLRPADPSVRPSA